MTSKIKTPLFCIGLILLCAAGQQAGAQSMWGGGDIHNGNLNWSDAANWSSGGAPGSSSTVTFPDGNYPVTTNTLGGINNIIGGNTTVSSLTFNNVSANNHYENTYIGIGTNLTVTGAITVGGTSIPSYAAFFGGGSLVGGGGSAALTVQSTSGTATMDLSGLTNFTFNAGDASGGTVNLGTGSSSASGTLTLAAVSNSIVCNTLNIGDNNTGGTELINLGNGTNNIFADTINLGVSKTHGTIQFLNNAGGGIKIANHTGTGRATINMGTEASSGSTGTVATGNMLFDGGTVNILAGTLTLANRSNRADSPGALANLFFNSGIVDVTTINMAINTSGGGYPTANLSVGGSGILKVGTGGMSMANQGGTAGTNVLTITNGATVICSNNIYKTTSEGTATITLSGSTLTMTSPLGLNTIGVADGNPIDNFNVTNCTLNLPVIGAGAVEVAIINFNPDQNTTNTINVNAIPGITSYPIDFPIFSYITAGGNITNEISGTADILTNLVLGTLPASININAPYGGYLTNEIGNSSIDLVLTNGPIVKSDVWNGGVSTNMTVWDTSATNWLTGGLLTNFNQGDQVTFPDNATNVVNLMGGIVPAAVNGVTFNNNVTNYILISTNGLGYISGQAGLTMNGSASVTLKEGGGDNFAGGITVNAGSLTLDDANSAISGGLTSGGSTTVQIGNFDSNGALPAGAISIGGSLIFDLTNSYTTSAAITGGGSLIVNGTTNTVITLTATNTYTGTTTVNPNSGKLALTGSGAIPDSSQITVDSNATLDVSGLTAGSGVTSLQALSMSNATLNVEVGYLLTNLNVGGALTFTGTTNVINVKSLPANAYYPTTVALVNAAGGITGFNLLGLGTLPTNATAYVGTISEAGSTTILLTLTAGPTNARPSVTWSGADALNTANTNWSDALNWQTPGTPAATEPVTFNNTDTAGGSPFNAQGDGIGGITSQGNVNNFVDLSLTNSALNYANTSGFHNTEIASGKTLTINGSVTVNGSSGDVSILGAGGTLQINDPNNKNTFNVEAISAPVLDMSGLDNYVANVNQIGIGYNLSNGNANYFGIWYLAKTNIISTGSGSSGAGAAWVIGGSQSQSSNSGYGWVFLGQTNAIYVDGIAMGLGSDPVSATGSELEFNSYLTGNNPVAYIRGITGPSSRVTLWSLGDDTVNINNGNDSYGHICDFSIGTLNAMVATLNVGQGNQGNTALPSGDVTGTFNMGAGNLNVLTLQIGVSDNGKTGGTGVGVMNVIGGTVVAGSLNLAVGTVVGTSGTLNLSNATLVASNGITIGTGNVGGTLSVSNSTVELLGGTIGTTTAPLSTLNVAGATFQMNLNGFSGTDIVSTNVTTNGLATIEIGSITNAFNGLTYPLISYAGSINDPFNSFSLAPLPVGYTGVLVDNISSGFIGLQLTSGPPLIRPVITGISISGSTLTLSATNGVDSAPFTLYETTNLIPPIVWTPVFTNSFSGTGTINLSTNVVNPSIPNEFYLLEEP